MKKIALIICLLSAISATAQQKQEEMVSVPKSALTQQQLAQVEAKNLQDKIDTYGKWVGIGHEIGTALNESLSAVTSQANNFAQTPVGKMTAALVIYKVLGKDFMGYVVGLCIALIGVPVWIWSYRKFLPRRYIASETFDPTTGKRIGRLYGYGYQDDGKKGSLTTDERIGWLVGHWVGMLVLMIFISMTIWG